MGEIHSLFWGERSQLGESITLLTGLGSESSVHMKLPQLDPKFLSADTLQSVICSSKAESITGFYVLQPKIFCGNLGRNAPSSTVVSSLQKLSKRLCCCCFKWIAGVLINSFFIWMFLLVRVLNSNTVQTMSFLNGLQARSLFCQGTQKRDVPLLFFSLMSFPLLDISHKVSLFSVPVSIRL